MNKDFDRVIMTQKQLMGVVLIFKIKVYNLVNELQRRRLQLDHDGAGYLLM